MKFSGDIVTVKTKASILLLNELFSVFSTRDIKVLEHVRFPKVWSKLTSHSSWAHNYL